MKKNQQYEYGKNISQIKKNNQQYKIKFYLKDLNQLQITYKKYETQRYQSYGLSPEESKYIGTESAKLGG